MNDGPCQIGLRAVRMYMGHDVMPCFAFEGLRHVIVDIVRVLPELIHLCLRDAQSELHFRLRQRNPQPAPCPEFLVGRKEILHLLTGISGIEGTLIGVSAQAGFLHM